MTYPNTADDIALRAAGSRLDALDDEDTAILLPGPTSTGPRSHGKMPARSVFTRKLMLKLAAALLSAFGLVIFYRQRLGADAPLQGETVNWYSRSEQVRDAFVHAYDDYMRIAFPHDELLPLTNETADEYVDSGYDGRDLRHSFLLGSTNGA